VYLKNNSTATPISVINQRAVVEGSLTAGVLYNFIKDPTTNSLKYLGSGGRFHVLATFDFWTEVSNNTCGFYIGRNTDPASGLSADADRISDSEVYIDCPSQSKPVGGAIQTIVDLNTNDRLFFIVQNKTAAKSITVEFLKFVAVTLTSERGATGATGAIPNDYVSSVNGITGALGITVAGNLTLTMTGADNKTFRIYAKPPAIVKGLAGALAFTDTTVPFEGDGSDLGADNALKYNYLSDLSFEAPGSIKFGTTLAGSYLEFPDGTTQDTAAKCCPIPIATTGSTGVASFDGEQFNVSTTGHVVIRTGIKAGNLIVLGQSTIFGAGGTGALPALDGSALTGVDAKYLQGKTPRQITDGGTF